MEWVFCILFVLLCGWTLHLSRKAVALRADIAAQSARFQEASEVEEIERVRREEMYQFLLNGMGDGVVVVDSDLIVTYTNRKARKLFGLSEDPVGTPLIRAFYNHRMVDLVQESIETDQWVNCEVVLADVKKGSKKKRCIRLKAAPLTGFEEGAREKAHHAKSKANQHLTRLIIRDETIRYETEQIRKDFVANASHELRTPLSIINGYIENLLEEGGLEDEAVARRFLGVMSKHGARIALIVEDMLTISKLESSDEELICLEPFDLADCLAGVLDRLKPIIEKKNALVENQFPENGVLLNGDRHYWDQIFFNLIENALKQNRAGLYIRISLKDKEGRYAIEIKDNGVGIPANAIPFIFKRFYRVAKHHNQGIKGTGLGLSIVMRAVEAHGGTISVSSTPGTVTKFTIKVPVGKPIAQIDGEIRSP